MFFKKRARDYSWKFAHERERRPLYCDLLLVAGWPLVFLIFSFIFDIFLVRTVFQDFFANSMAVRSGLFRLMAVCAAHTLSFLVILTFIRSLPKAGPVLFGVVVAFIWGTSFIYSNIGVDSAHLLPFAAVMKTLFTNPLEFLQAMRTVLNVRICLYLMLLVITICFWVQIIYGQDRRIYRPAIVCLIFFLLSVGAVLYLRGFLKAFL